jgi:3D (Asp-Asp-Asp) domain-containing protein
LAIVSITLNSTSQQYEVVEAKTNTKTNDTSLEKKSTLINSPILAVLADANTILPATDIIVENSNTEIVPKEEMAPEALKVAKKQWVTVTAYSSTVDQTDSSPFYTASGTHVHNGTIASNFLKFGTKVRFPSVYPDRIFIVEDRMNVRFNSRVDIWFPTRQEAKSFGAKHLEIEILQ